MALGGGTYTTQNKVLPGAYFQFVSNATALAGISDRGVAAMAMELDWGTDGKIFDVTAADLQKNSMALFGHDYSSDKLKGLRDLFCYASTLHCYKLNSNGVKASNDYATAISTGIRGNDLRIVITANVDDESLFDVITYLETTKVDEQTVSKMAELNDSSYVVWKKDAVLALTAGVPLSGGTNGDVNGESHQTFLDKLESYPDTNAVGYAGTDEAVKLLYIAFAKRMRDEVGIKMQAVVHRKAGDSIACVNVKNTVNDADWNAASSVYWATGVIAGMAANKSATNLTYNGEFDINTDYTQKELESAILAGEWTLHQVGSEVHVLEDINSLVTVSETEGEVFKDNQTVRIIDTIATSVASVFAQKYLGKIPNNASGRISLWSDICSIHQNLADIGCLEEFSESDVVVEQGESKKSVLVTSAITVVNAITKLYMKVELS